MESRPRMALRKRDTPPNIIMRSSKADNNLNHSPCNANQISLIERNNPVTTTRKPRVPIKNRKIGPMEITCVLNIVFRQPPMVCVRGPALRAVALDTSRGLCLPAPCSRHRLQQKNLKPALSWRTVQGNA